MTSTCLRSTKSLLLRTLMSALKPQSSSSSFLVTRSLLFSSTLYRLSDHKPTPLLSATCRSYCSNSSHLDDILEGPAAVDYGSLLQEDKYHDLADATIHYLLERLEEYGDSVDIDEFDVDYGNEVLTLKVGSLGTYVINKQTPNRQIWLSSPLSGPSRFDWDPNTQTWIYRRTKENLYEVLEEELEELCSVPITFS